MHHTFGSTASGALLVDVPWCLRGNARVTREAPEQSRSSQGPIFLFQSASTYYRFPACVQEGEHRRLNQK